ncbi:hypothetical protein JCM11641_008198 [Rhodosporidiobolus odoratus]
MGKLKKARPSHVTPVKESLSSPTASVISTSSSTVRPVPSILSSSTVKTQAATSPIALKTSKKAATAVVSGAEAFGEWDGMEHNSGGRGRNSPVHSAAASSDRSPSPASSFSFRRTPVHTRNHTRDSTHESPPSPVVTPVFAGSTSSPSFSMASGSPSETSALLHLRKRLDSDKAARAAAEVRRENAKSSAKLRKKSKTKQEETVAAKKQEDGEEEARQADEIADEPVDQDLSTARVEDDSTTLPVLDAMLVPPVETDDPLVPLPNEVPSLHIRTDVSHLPSSSTSSVPLERDSAPSAWSPIALFRTSTALALAPARMTYRLTSSSALLFSSETRRNVLRNVPLAGRMVSPPPSLSLEDLERDEESRGGYYGDSFFTSSLVTLSSVRSSAPISHIKSVFPTMPRMPSILSTQDEATDLLARATELALGVGLAGVLVSLAVGGMVWERVTKSRKQRSKEVGLSD